MERNKNVFRQRIAFIYGTVICVMLLILMAITVGKDKAETAFGLGDYMSITEDWQDQAGNPFRFADIDSYTEEGEEYIWVYYDVTKVSRNTSLFFRSKNAYVTVYEDEREVYRTDLTAHTFYNHSPGTRWNLIPLSPDTEKIRLQIKLAYHDGRSKVDNFYLGDGARMIVETIREKLAGILASFLILCVGVLFFIADLILNRWSEHKDHSLRYLGLFAVITAVWCLLETNILQLFCRDIRILQVMNNMCLVVGSIPLFIYLDYSFHIFRYRVNRIICSLNLGYIIFATICHLLGGWDFHQTLNGAVLALGLVSITLIIAVFAPADTEESAKRGRYRRWIQRIGIIAIGAGVAGDLFRYLMSDVMDRAAIIRYGFLVTIICFGIGNILDLFRLVEQGRRAKMISKLAYSDGLTELGNRTAYMERLQELAEKEWGKIGIIMADINNLKAVNDTMGHHKGDELIMVCVAVMKDTFGKAGEIYRIGGDEFVILLTGEQPEAVYEELLLKFKEKIASENTGGKYEFQVAIAHGVAYCVPDTREILDMACKDADEKMYEEKKRMKGMDERL